MPERMLGLIAIALLVAACAQQGGGVLLSEAELCAQGGGVWRPALGVCDRAADGEGGY